MCIGADFTLASDILAEMDYPHSGIASLQDAMPYPQTWTGEEDLSKVMQSYVNQLYLRKRLNYMHNNIYGKSCTCPPQPR